jgi:hypothetical protein
MRTLLFLLACLAVTINTYTFSDILPYFELSLSFTHKSITMEKARKFEKVCSDAGCHFAFVINFNIDNGHGPTFKGPVNTKVKLHPLN